VKLFGTAPHKCAVVQMETGGGFGGKEEYPSLIAGACRAARAQIRPSGQVDLRPRRRHGGDDEAAPVAHTPPDLVDRDGRLVAMDIEFLLDGGAYCTLSPVVLSRGTIHAPGPYFCPNVRVRAKAARDEHAPHGAFRGFGAPQSLFALERHMDVVAKAVGLSPEEFRRRNFIQEGQTSAVGQVMREAPNMDKLLSRALELSDYHAKVAKFSARNPSQSVKKGIGFATFMHGAGFHGSGEDHLASVVEVEATAEAAFACWPQARRSARGRTRSSRRIAADALGIDLGDIEIIQPDTGVVPNSGPTVASRTCMVVGHLGRERRCARSPRARLARPRARAIHTR
jgi:CO/xanthine dehydrogenase Mo-binding subunit